eukprot:TRINITY_DN73501_c0_g1_i2.p1 TRINITY_DN73501_c0_g1~~TRINITY_DN73501_c0_g1_i2.p1  ORF type:complete len:138 (+),score=32.04 TRINITY_DN73501_c0_g1_i2:113-526(+)
MKRPPLLQQGYPPAVVDVDLTAEDFAKRCRVSDIKEESPAGDDIAMANSSMAGGSSTRPAAERAASQAATAAPPDAAELLKRYIAQGKFIDRSGVSDGNADPAAPFEPAGDQSYRALLNKAALANRMDEDNDVTMTD